MTDVQRDAVTNLLPRHGLQPPLDLRSLFDGRPVALEIGFGLGHATVEMALEDPGMGIVAVDVHTPGVARLLAEIDRLGLTNVRVELGDAVDLLADRVAEGSLDAITVFSSRTRGPRPGTTSAASSGPTWCTSWPRASPPAASCTARPTGSRTPRRCARCSTPSRCSWTPYDGWAPRLERPLTKFERQGVEKGHVVRDLVRTRA